MMCDKEFKIVMFIVGCGFVLFMFLFFGMHSNFIAREKAFAECMRIMEKAIDNKVTHLPSCRM